MLVELIETKQSPCSLDFLSETIHFLEKKLIEKQVLPSVLDKKIIITFLSEESMKNLNKTFLNKNNTTDVLSFSPMEEDYVGELALCEEKVRTQSKEHNLTFEQEVVYLVLHGILHLLGFHHEQGGEEARQMFEIQDDIFKKWQDQFKKG